MRIGLLVVAGLALLGFVMVAFVLPRMGAEEARQAAQALLEGAQSAQRQVAAAAEKVGTVAGSGKDVKVPARNDPRHGDLKWLISEGGDIRAWNEKNVIEVTLVPQLQAGKTEWTCRGYPKPAMPASCAAR
jgi:hypothetical protein